MVILSTNAYQNQKMVDDEPAGGCATTYSFILCGVEGDIRWIASAYFMKKCSYIRNVFTM